MTAKSKRSQHMRRHKQQAEAHVPPQTNLKESPLAWLARHKDKDGRPLISDVELNAGEKLRADFWFAGMTPQVSSNWNGFLTGGSRKQGGAGFGPDLADNIIASRERVRLALKGVGPELAGILIDVCCHLKGLEFAEKAGGWPQRSGKVVLGIALRHLARHYGMTPSAQHAAKPRTARINHWGTQDYRPQIDNDAG